jgi:EspG family
MTSALRSEFSLSDDELQVAAARVAVEDFPTVLAVRPRHGNTEALQRAFDHATRALVSRGLITDGLVTSDLGSQLWALGRPDRELAMRLVTPDGIVRVAAVRRGSLGVLARRVCDEFLVSTVHDAGLREATRALIAQLRPADPARIDPVGAPLEAVTECLAGVHAGPQLADRVRALGVERRSAMLLGSALSSRMAFAEIVYSHLAGDDGRISRFPAAVAVFYTKRGRIVAAPSASPTGQLWTTLKPGSDHAINQAIGQLIGLSTERWEGL